MVVGAGVIGLAVARALALAGIEVLVLEQAYTIGFETSSRNSEVIHGGLYYPVGSLKARSCVEGRASALQLLPRARRPTCPAGQADRRHQRGRDSWSRKDRLDGPRQRGQRFGMAGCEMQARQLEPALNCVAALLSPSTGIIDSHALMLAYQGDAEAAGAIVVLRTPVLSGHVRHDGFELAIGGDEPTGIRCRSLVNAAGLHAPALARMIEGIPPETIPPVYFCRGVYFTLSGPAPFHRLIYPVPVAGGLGVHITLDLAGHARFGPDVEWISSIDYTVEPARGGVFLCRNPHLLARFAGWRVAAGLCRHPAEDQRAGRAGGRLRRTGPRYPRSYRVGKPIRHRIAGANGVIAAGQRGGAREFRFAKSNPKKRPCRQRRQSTRGQVRTSGTLSRKTST